MNAPRAAARAGRIIKRAPLRTNVRQIRPQSTASSSNVQAAASGGSSGLVGGIAGGAIVFAAAYGYYHFSGAKSIVNTATATKKQFSQIAKSMQDAAPEPNELLKWFRQTTTSYAAFIPGAKTYVDAAFNDIDAIEQKHRGEVNEIVSKAYTDMKAASKNGLSIETAQQTWEVLQKALSQLAELAGDSAGEILDNHPEVKKMVGGNIDQLKGMAKSYGPEAQKELDATYSQIKDVLAGGVGVGTVEKVRQIVQEKIEKVKKLGDDAWKRGMEQAKPYLDKNPKIKELIEKNADVLKAGNVGELYEKLKDGNTDTIQTYINDATEKAKKGGAGVGKDLEKYVKMIPGGDKIFPKLMQLQEVAKKHGDEAEKILKETYDEIAEVLQKRTKQAEKLANKAKEEAK